jgi:hypothetical protein
MDAAAFLFVITIMSVHVSKAHDRARKQFGQARDGELHVPSSQKTWSMILEKKNI